MKQLSLSILYGLIGMSMGLAQTIHNKAIAACPTPTVPQIVRPTQTTNPRPTVPQIVRPPQTTNPRPTIPQVVRPARTTLPSACGG